MSICTECAERIDYLEEEIKILKDCLAPEPLYVSIQKTFKVERNAAKILAALLSHDSRSKDQLMNTLYIGREDEPWGPIIRVYVRMLRKKIGVSIISVRHHGYHITKQEKGRIYDLLQR